MKVISTIIGILLLLWVLQGCPKPPSYYYEYTDMYGNTGVAKYCDNSGKMLSCENGHTIIQVQSYTKIEERDDE